MPTPRHHRSRKHIGPRAILLASGLAALILVPTLSALTAKHLTTAPDKAKLCAWPNAQTLSSATRSGTSSPLKTLSPATSEGTYTQQDPFVITQDAVALRLYAHEAAPLELPQPTTACDPTVAKHIKSFTAALVTRLSDDAQSVPDVKSLRAVRTATTREGDTLSIVVTIDRDRPQPHRLFDALTIDLKTHTVLTGRDILAQNKLDIDTVTTQVHAILVAKRQVDGDFTIESATEIKATMDVLKATLNTNQACLTPRDHGVMLFLSGDDKTACAIAVGPTFFESARMNAPANAVAALVTSIPENTRHALSNVRVANTATSPLDTPTLLLAFRDNTMFDLQRVDDTSSDATLHYKTMASGLLKRGDTVEMNVIYAETVPSHRLHLTLDNGYTIERIFSYSGRYGNNPIVYLVGVPPTPPPTS